MEKYARIENGIVVEVIDFNPLGRFTDEIVSQFTECPLEVAQGWKHENGKFIEQNNVSKIISPYIDQELATAYEAIAMLYEEIQLLKGGQV